MWNLLHSVKGLWKYPSVTCGDSSPKGEPMHQKGAYKKIPATFSPQLPRNVTRYTIFRENVSNLQKSWE